MWIAGLDALRKPLLHLHTQANVALPWADIDMDFMNLNQAAHGDREFGYIQTRLRCGAQDRRRARQRSSGAAAGRRLGAGRRGAAHALRVAAAGPLRRQHARRGRHRGRQGRGAARFGVSVNTYGVNDLVAVVDAVADADVDALVAEYDDALRRGGRPAPAGAARSRCATAARIELGLRAVPRARRLRRLHEQLRGPRWAAAAARAWPCSG